MRIGFFIGTLREEIGGGYTLLGSLLEALESLETRHEIFVFYYGAPRPARETGKLHYQSLSSDRKLPWLLDKGKALLSGKDTSMLQLAADHFQIDLIWALATDLVPIDTPFICTILDLEYRAHPFFPEVGTLERWRAAETLYKELVRRAAYVISGTATGREQILSYFQADATRTRVIPFPVASFALEGKGSATPGSPCGASEKAYLFYPAQFWPHKNHIALLHALKVLRDDHGLALDLVLSGSDRGNLAHVKETCRELGLELQVHFLGFVTTGELRELYAGAFALVYPSFFGPDNLPPLEAFAIGCPVIAARVNGAADQLGDDVLYFDPLRAEELARAVLALHADPGLREQLIRKGKARPRWTAEEYLGQVMAVIDEFEGYRRCWSSSEKFRLS